MSEDKIPKYELDLLSTAINRIVSSEFTEVILGQLFRLFDIQVVLYEISWEMAFLQFS